jgi:hypothetical protein
VSDLEKYPESENTNSKGEEAMFHINPIRRDDLKAAEVELTTEKGAGVFSDEDVIQRAIENKTKSWPFDPLETQREKLKYLHVLALLREHPEGWSSKPAAPKEPDTFERQARRRGTLPKVSGWWATREGIKNPGDKS